MDNGMDEYLEYIVKPIEEMVERLNKERELDLEWKPFVDNLNRNLGEK